VSVGIVLERGVRGTHYTWAVEEASKRAKELYMINHILPNCTSDQLESTLPNLIRRRLWKSVGVVLKRGVSDTHHIWAVKRASKKSGEVNFINHILPHCTVAQLETALTHLVSRQLWKCVSLVLKRGVSAEMLVWAISEACKCFTYSTVMRGIEDILGPSRVQLLFKSLASTHLPPDYQSVALRFALQQNR
jgi:hypothetical protein